MLFCCLVHALMSTVVISALTGKRNVAGETDPSFVTVHTLWLDKVKDCILGISGSRNLSWQDWGRSLSEGMKGNFRWCVTGSTLVWWTIYSLPLLCPALCPAHGEERMEAPDYMHFTMWLSQSSALPWFLCVSSAGMNALQLQNLATLAAAAAAAQTSATTTNANPLSTATGALGALTSPGMTWWGFIVWFLFFNTKKCSMRMMLSVHLSKRG